MTERTSQSGLPVLDHLAPLVRAHEIAGKLAPLGKVSDAAAQLIHSGATVAQVNAAMREDAIIALLQCWSPIELYTALTRLGMERGMEIPPNEERMRGFMSLALHQWGFPSTRAALYEQHAACEGIPVHDIPAFGG